MYDEDDFYYPRPEFEEEIENLKEILTSSIKEKHLSKIENLEKENARLSEIEKNLKKHERDIEVRQRALEAEYQKKLRDVKGMHIKDLLSENQIEYWGIVKRENKGPQCNKCDENRNVRYITPLGRNSYESCLCDKSVYQYEPNSAIMYSFNFKENSTAYYRINTSSYRDDYLRYQEDSISKGDDFIDDESKIDVEKSYYNLLFATKELAEKYCELKNAKEFHDMKNCGEDFLGH